MNDREQKLWLKWNSIYKRLHHIKYDYVGKREKENIDDIISYIKKLMDELQENE
jgi:hypothetical protein